MEDRIVEGTAHRDRTEQQNPYREMDESMDIQLHPFRDSTWAEIFPVLSIFEALCSNGDAVQTGTKGHEFLKNEAVNK